MRIDGFSPARVSCAKIAKVRAGLGKSRIRSPRLVSGFKDLDISYADITCILLCYIVFITISVYDAYGLS